MAEPGPQVYGVNMPSTRDRVLATAKQLVIDDGSGAVSMRKIGSIVGVTPMAVYRHFPNREALLDAVAAECFADLAERWRRLDFPEDVLRATTMIVDAFVDVALKSPGLFTFLFIEKRQGARRFPDDFSADSTSPTFDLLTGYLDAAVADGRIRPIEPWRIALAHTALVHGLSQLYLGGRVNLSPDEFRRVCHETTELLVNGTTPR